MALFSSTLDIFDSYGGTTLFPEVGSASLLKPKQGWWRAFFHPASTLQVYRPSLAELPVGNQGSDAREANRQLKNQEGERQYFGQFGEDCQMRSFMQRIGFEPDSASGKVFLEMGALNGVRYSNSLFFERQGWHGVMIEAAPSNCEALKVNRRSGRTINVCAGICKSGEGPLQFELHGSAAQGKMVFDELPLDATAQQRASRIRVPCLPLGQVLQDLAIPRLSYFSLDVEGAEELVMNTYNWSVPIDILQFERNRRKSDAQDSMHTLLRSHGMHKLGGSNFNDIVYVSSEIASRMDRLTFKGTSDPAFTCNFTQWHAKDIKARAKPKFFNTSANWGSRGKGSPVRSYTGKF